MTAIMWSAPSFFVVCRAGSVLKVGVVFGSEHPQHWLAIFVRIAGRIEQPNDYPPIRMARHRTNKKMGVILVNHFGFISLPEGGLPAIAILGSPLPIRLRHL